MIVVKSTNTPHICDVCNTKEKSSSRSISNKTIINDHVSINNDIPLRSNLSKCNYVLNHSQVDRNNEKYIAGFHLTSKAVSMKI